MHASAAFAILALVGSGLAAPMAANAYPAKYAPPETYSPPEYTPPEYTAPKEHNSPPSYPKGYNPDAPTYPETYNPPAYQPEHHHEQTQAANVCGQNQQASCCNSPTGEGVLAASCALSILGNTCAGSVQCCSVSGDGSLIALNLCVPISL